MLGTIFSWFKEYGVLLLELIKEHGKKAVFTILLLAVTIFTVSYVIDYKIKKIIPETVEQSVSESIENNIVTQENIHMQKLIESQEIYSEVKTKLRSTLKETGCEYIYLIEYHNGSTNMATTFPFRKFDVTMDICKEGVPYIETSMFKDEHVTKYDIFDNPEFIGQQFACCTAEEFKKVDIKLYHNFSQNKNIKWVYTYNLYYEGNLLGAVLILSYKELNMKAFVNCMHELEDVFNS